MKLRPLKKVVTKLREASFQESGPKLFNNLPTNIRNLNNISVEEFKGTLDKVISEVPDEPKVDGLTPAAMTGLQEEDLTGLCVFLSFLQLV